MLLRMLQVGQWERTGKNGDNEKEKGHRSRQKEKRNNYGSVEFTMIIIRLAAVESVSCMRAINFSFLRPRDRECRAKWRETHK